VPLMLRVAAGTSSVPSPLKRMISTMAFGDVGVVAGEMVVNPVAANTYKPSSVPSVHLGPLLARATPDIPDVIIATSKLPASTTTRSLMEFLFLGCWSLDVINAGVTKEVKQTWCHVNRSVESAPSDRHRGWSTLRSGQI